MKKMSGERISKIWFDPIVSGIGISDSSKGGVLFWNSTRIVSQSFEFAGGIKTITH
jgi:hypothetical protein